MQPVKLPSYHYEGEIWVEPDQEYTQGYLQFPFDVPPGVEALRLRLRYVPLEVGGVSNLITLGLADPRGFRGNAHRYPPDPEIYLSPQRAAPGFFQGAIFPGRWLAQLAIQSVVADSVPCAYALDIELLQEEEEEPADPADLADPVYLQDPRDRQDPRGLQSRAARPVLEAPEKQPGWFRGELHSHTNHSDGDLPPMDLLARAQENGLNFLAVTDHNTITALQDIDALDHNNLLIIPGMELTTFSGHALALGVERWIDWRTGYDGWKMEDAARETRALGGLFIMAHPNDFGSPVCTGCRWEYPDFDLDLVDAIEIWNSRWNSPSDGNPTTLRAWRQLQMEVRRIPATCGCDFHRLADWGAGLPFSYVYAGELSAPAILEGIRQGRVIISSGPWLSLEASTSDGSARAGIGDTLRVNGGQAMLEIGWKDTPENARLVVRVRAGVMDSRAVGGEGRIRYELAVQDEERVWVELYGADGALLAMTNPVYLFS